MKKIYLPLFLITLTFFSCTIPQMVNSLPNLKYNIESANNFSIANIPLSGKTKIEDFNPFDIIKLTGAALNKSIPLTFTINVDIKNPGKKSGSSSTYSTMLKSFPWELYLNGKKTIMGNIPKPLEVPTPGNSRRMPISISVNVFSFITNNSINDILNLVLKASGSGGKSTKIKLIAQPTFETPLGDFKWPKKITIVNKRF